MLKVECESCKAPYQVDERRVPQTGLKMRCPKCGHTFLVSDPAKGGAAAAPGAPPPKRQHKPTMVGIQAPSAPIAPAAPAPEDDALDLPAVRPAAPKARPQAAPAPPPPPPPAPAPAPAAAGFGALDDFDLPALPDEVDLPAALHRPQAAPKPAPAPAAPPPAASPAGGAFNFDIDLPSPVASAPPPFGSVDLPMAAAPGDLPIVAGGDLPAVAHGNLPAPAYGLPAPAHGNLPAPAHGNLPAVAHGNLPAPAYGNLPAPAFGNLPAPANNLPMPAGGFGEIDLPLVQNDLPANPGANAHMPMPVGDDRLLPNAGGGAFGEFDLPVVGAGLPQASRGAEPGNFGEIDLGGGSAPLGGGGGGALGFGEVDLGGDQSPVVAPPPAVSAGSLQQEEEKQAGRPARRVVRRGSGPSLRVPKVAAIAVALLVVGGASLQFTSYGAFGHLAISDRLHRAQYDKAGTDAAQAARERMAVDTFAAARAAADELAAARQKLPRSRPLSAYAAFIQYSNELRFGPDPDRTARVSTWLNDMPADGSVNYLRLARAARDAAQGDLAKGRAGLEAARRDPGPGAAGDAALVAGEIALAQKDAKGAIALFEEAVQTSSTARSQFGLARAHFLARNMTQAKEAVAATLAASAGHAGALTLRAAVVWELTRDDVSAMRDLSAVLTEQARAVEGPSEVSQALATKGWILFARDRTSEARAAFEEAVKIDGRNVTALVGQGEILYADGRYSEALTRFDEAVGKDPNNLNALVGSAKSKISLERLKEAKDQLTAARATYPKEMAVALWLAKAEEALGNKSAAERLYDAALTLVDPQNPDSIQAFAGYAAFLAAQGRTTDAQEKLDLARSKLPDSAQLQRAFGDVAVAQGHFDEAIGHYQSALQKNPHDLGTRFRLGVAYRKMRKLDMATAEFDKVVAIDKDYPGIALERGILFEESGDVKKALEQFQGAFERAPNDLDLMLRVGAAYVAIDRVKDAFPLLKKVLEQRPNSAEANHFLGRAYLKQGGLEAASATRFLKRAVDLDPNRAEYHLYVAWAANEASPAQLGLARTHIDRALQLDKLLADGYWQRGVVARREGAVNDAIRDLKRALDLKPNRHEAHATLAECYEDKNDRAAALAEWAKAIGADDKPPYWRFRYGKLLMDAKRASDAAPHLAYAVKEAQGAQPRPGWLVTAAFESGEAHQAVGATKEAVDAYKLYLDLAPPTAPDRKDALKALTALGASYDQ
ncbi:MAG: tetratricopeptide repeat protein [Polyangiaceae bacterium]